LRKESQTTAYFVEDLDAAQEAVDEAVAAFDQIVKDIDEEFPPPKQCI